MSKKQVAEDLGKIALKKLGSIWSGVGKPVATNVAPTQMGRELIPYVAPAVKGPNLLNKATNVLWNNRSIPARVAEGLVAAPLIPHIPSAINSLIHGYAGLFGGGNTTTSNAPLYDPTQIKTPEQSYMDSQKPLWDILQANYSSPQDQALRDYTQSLTSGISAPSAVGGNVQSGFTKQQLAAQDAATQTGGTDIGMSTPVAGETAARLDAFNPASQAAQDAMNNYQANAKAAGVNLGNNWKLQFLQSLNADYLAQRKAAKIAMTNQQLQDAANIAAIRQKGIILPDPNKLRAKAIEYNNLSSNDKLFYKGQGINNVNDYVNNYIKTTQG